MKRSIYTEGMKKQFYTVKECAKVLGFTRQWISKQCHFENIKSQQLGREYIISVREVEKWKKKIDDGADRHLLFPRCKKKD